jgi:hypothetical protein
MTLRATGQLGVKTHGKKALLLALQDGDSHA